MEASAAAAAGKSMRTTPQPVQVGVPVSLTAGGLTIGRSSSPATRAPPTAYQPSNLSQRVLPTADPVRFHLPMHAAAPGASPFAGIRDPTAFLRGTVSLSLLLKPCWVSLTS